MRMISVDPGVEAGIAIWNSDSLINALALIPPKHDVWMYRVFQVGDMIEYFIKHHTPTLIACEWPFYIESEGGREVASTGSLVKLSVCVGMVMEKCARRGIEFRRVEVRDWKGQMPKSAVIHRIKKRMAGHPLLGEIKSHAWDAVGIGLHVLGKL